MNTRNLNVTTLVSGMLFVALGAMFLLDAADVWTVDPLIVGPALLIGLGIAIIAGSLAKRSV